MENAKLIKNAVKYIDRLCTDKTTIEDVAKNAGFSMDYFNRIFRNHTGFNVMEYSRFRRLSKAATMLRLSPEKDILSIGLECGYESHEGFTRAFKEQYNQTPSEYRENMRDKPFVWADHELNATAVSEFCNFLPEFFEKDSNEVINWLLSENSKRYGYTAITIAVNGSKIVSEHDSDSLVIIDNFYEKPHLTLIMTTICGLRKYIEKLLLFSPSDIDVIFHTDMSLEDVRSELNGVQYKRISERAETMYFGDPFTLPAEAEKYDIHFLSESDYDAVDSFISQHQDEAFRKTGGFGLKNSLKNPLSHRWLDQPAGVFDNNRLLAISYEALQSTHGFCLNNCVHTVRFPDAPNEAIKYLYLFATNAVMEKGYIPFEDAQFGEYAKRHGEFDAFELGFERVNTVYTIDF